MSARRANISRGKLLQEMGILPVGFMRNWGLNESHKNEPSDTVVRPQDKNIPDYDNGTFDDAVELPERNEPDGERSDSGTLQVKDTAEEGSDSISAQQLLVMLRENSTGYKKDCLRTQGSFSNNETAGSGARNGGIYHCVQTNRSAAESDVGRDTFGRDFQITGGGDLDNNWSHDRQSKCLPVCQKPESYVSGFSQLRYVEGQPKDYVAHNTLEISATKNTQNYLIKDFWVEEPVNLNDSVIVKQNQLGSKQEQIHDRPINEIYDAIGQGTAGRSINCQLSDFLIKGMLDSMADSCRNVLPKNTFGEIQGSMQNISSERPVVESKRYETEVLDEIGGKSGQSTGFKTCEIKGHFTADLHVDASSSEAHSEHLSKQNLGGSKNDGNFLDNCRRSQPLFQCRNCGKEGHLARDCRSGYSSEFNHNAGVEGRTQNYEPSKQSSQKCYNCGQEGHVSRDCSSKKIPGNCHKCGEEGHFARDCPSKQIFGMDGHGVKDYSKQTSSGCHVCGQEGHFARNCPSKQKSGEVEGHVVRDHPKQVIGGCHNCGQEGHFSRDCPTKSTSFKCHSCGQEGHIARSCPKKQQPRSQCFTCNEEGHMSKDCPSKKTPLRFMNRSQNDLSVRECPLKKTTDSACNESGLGMVVFSSESLKKYPEVSSYRSSAGTKISETPRQASFSAAESSNRNLSRDCRKCGVEGHFARDCPMNNNSKTNDENRPPPYFPPPPPEDEALIFEQLLKGINFCKYDEIPVECTGRNAPVSSMSSFFNCGLSEILQINIRRSKYDIPTPIQKWAIPVILDGRDLMACALTGSGKTAAFLLPIMTKIIQNESAAAATYDGVQSPEAVVLVPTRELATQIYNQARKFGYGSVVRLALIYGGVAYTYLQAQLKNRISIVIATPGRLLSLVKQGQISLAKVKHFVLDEADRLLELGFLENVLSFAKEFGMPSAGVRQTLMFSATFPDEIQCLAAELLKDYIFITVGCLGGANQDIEQVVYSVQHLDKRKKLLEILQQSGKNRVLVFVELKRIADFLSNHLTQAGFPTASIHGDLSQKEREEGLRDFRNGQVTILVATSVAARGLDIAEIAHVINYDLPCTIEEYIHRIGRTGRCGNLGKASSFFDPSRDSSLARSLVRVLADSRQIVPEWLEHMSIQAPGGTNRTPQRTGRRFEAGDRKTSFEPERREPVVTTSRPIKASEPDDSWDD